MPFGRPKKPRTPLVYDELLDYAVKSLSAKMKSIRDLRRKLLDRAEPGPDGERDADAVLTKLKDLGYLSDERFAADYTRLRQENDKFGRRRVQQGLMQKGIASPLVSETLDKAYEDVDEVALARQYIARKRMKKPEGDREQRQKESARAMRRLIAAGFSPKAVYKVLREWEPELEEVDIDDTE
jgi:regulatory protein